MTIKVQQLVNLLRLIARLQSDTQANAIQAMGTTKVDANNYIVDWKLVFTDDVASIEIIVTLLNRETMIVDELEFHDLTYL